MIKLNHMSLLEEIKADYDLCINNPYEYQKKVDTISNLFSLKGRQRFKGDYCPVYVFGKYHLTPFVMLGINPGFSSKNSPVEDKEAKKVMGGLPRSVFEFFSLFL
jgi:hypothetical protein